MRGRSRIRECIVTNEQRAWALAGSLLRDTALLLTIALLNRTLHALGADSLVFSTLILRSTSRRLSYVHRISHGRLELCRIQPGPQSASRRYAKRPVSFLQGCPLDHSG